MGLKLANAITNLKSSSGKSKNVQLGLQDFYNVATERGFARDFHFRVTQIGDSKLENDELVYVRATQAPEREILSDVVSFRGFKFNVPLTSIYPGSDNWTVEFLMDRQYKIYDLIETWHRSYFNEATLIGHEVPTFNNLVEMIAIDEQLNIVKKFKLYGCFPRKLGALKYNIAGQGAPVSFELTLAYQYWTSDTVSSSTSENKSLIDMFLGGLRTASGVFQGGTNIIRSIKSIPGL